MTTFMMPSDTFNPRSVDEEFQWQAEQIRAVGGSIMLVDMEDPDRPRFRNLDEDADNIVYRGWMLPLNAYAKMETSLCAKNAILRTSVRNYEQGHHLPGWYETFKHLTPATVWFDVQSIPETELAHFKGFSGDGFIVKDFVKSRKHEWATACYAPSVKELPSVISEFIRLQTEDDSLVGGVIIRDFEHFDKSVGEARVWWVNGQPVLMTAHPDTPDLTPQVDDLYLDEVQESVQKLDTSFVTTDIAMNTDGNWRVIEVGDGQVSGLPVGVDASPLWKALMF